jgi:hypothetical protein
MIILAERVAGLRRGSPAGYPARGHSSDLVRYDDSDRLLFPDRL